MYAPPLTAVGGVLNATPVSTTLSPLIGPPVTQISVQEGTNVRTQFPTVAMNHEGQVVHLGVWLGNVYAETENQFLFSLFTLQQTSDQNWVTESYVFDSYMAQETPSQVPPPLGSYRKNRQSGTLKRYAFGVQMLLDALKDPEGDMIHYAQTVQCLQSFVRTLETIVLSTIINTRAQYLAFWAEAADFSVSLKSRASAECVTWNALQRYPDAAAVLLDLAQNAFAQSQRGRVTAVIVHQGFRSIVSSTPKMTEYSRRGPGNQDFNDARGDAAALQNTLPGTNVRIYVASPINATGQGVYHDMMQRAIENGGWAAIDNYGSTLPPEEFRSSWTDVSPFDADDDNFRTITLPQALEYCGRFDSSPAGKLSPLHRRLAAEAKSIAARNKLAIVHGRVDMFCYLLPSAVGEAWAEVTHYGHMEPWALTPAVLRYHSITMRNLLTRKLGDVHVAGLKNGERLMQELQTLQLTAADAAFAKACQPPPAANRSVSAGHYAGGPELAKPDAAGFPAAIRPNSEYKPRFFGSPGGLFTLGLSEASVYPYIDKSLFAVGRAYFNAVAALWHTLADIYGPDHPLLSPAYTPWAFRSPLEGPLAAEYNGYMTLAHNALAGNPQVVMLRANDATRLTPLTGYLADKLETIRRRVSPIVRGNFADDTAVAALAKKFNDGPMATAYRAFRQSTRGAESARSGARVAVAGPADLFQQFMKEEVLEPLDKVPKLGAGDAAVDDVDRKAFMFNEIMRHIIGATERGVEYQFSRETLDALTSEQAYAAHKALAGATGDAASTRFYHTRLVVSPSTLFAYKQGLDGAASDIELSSGVSPAQVARDPAAVASALREQARSDSNIASYVMSSTAHAGRGGAQADAHAAFQTAGGQAPFTAFADIGRDVVTDAFGRSTFKTNKNLLARVAAANKEQDLLTRVAALMLITAEVEKRTLVKFYEENVAPPVAVLCARPRRRFRTVAMIFLAVDQTLGRAMFALPDVRRGVDAARKSMFDHWSMYLGCMIMDAARIMVMPDVLIVGYDGGVSVKPVLPPGADTDANRTAGSMYYILSPAGSLYGREATVHATMDVRGRFSHQLAQFSLADQGSIDFLQKSSPHHPSAIFTCFQHQFDAAMQRGLPTELMFQSASTRVNWIVSRELALVHTHPGQTVAVTPADLLDKRVFPSVVKEWTSGVPAANVGHDPHINTHFLPN